MILEERIAVCKTCSNRALNAEIGLVCSLTDAKPEFEDHCETYTEDIAAINNQQSAEALQPSQVKQMLSIEEIEKMRLEQNLMKGIGISVAVGILCAFIWQAISVASGYQIGFMAVGVGAAVGFTMRHSGNGIDQIFGLSGAAIAILSCLLGNFLTIIGFVAAEGGYGFFELLFSFDAGMFFPLMAETFDIMDLLFYGIAGVEGYKFAFREVIK